MPTAKSARIPISIRGDSGAAKIRVNPTTKVRKLREHHNSRPFITVNFTFFDRVIFALEDIAVDLDVAEVDGEPSAPDRQPLEVRDLVLRRQRQHDVRRSVPPEDGSLLK